MISLAIYERFFNKTYCYLSDLWFINVVNTITEKDALNNVNIENLIDAFSKAKTWKDLIVIEMDFWIFLMLDLDKYLKRFIR